MGNSRAEDGNKEKLPNFNNKSKTSTPFTFQQFLTKCEIQQKENSNNMNRIFNSAEKPRKHRELDKEYRAPS